jgi:hypothetical protein
MKNWRALFLATVLLTGAASAAEVATFDSCTDATGRTLTAEADYSQKVLLTTAYVQGQPVIRYNPGVLPRLTFDARLFLYSHQCARPAQAATLAQARQADCIALATLVAGGIMTREDIPALQSKLNFTESEWELLPGPPRSFDLASCRTTGGVLRLPPSAAPSARQTEWNNCSRACGDRLWGCQKRCGAEACVSNCMQAHGQCVAACGEKPPN